MKKEAVVRAVVTNCGHAMRHADGSMQQNEAVVLAAVSKGGGALAHADEAVIPSVLRTMDAYTDIDKIAAACGSQHAHSSRSASHSVH